MATRFTCRIGFVLWLFAIPSQSRAQPAPVDTSVTVQIEDENAAAFRIPDRSRIKRIEAEIYNAPRFLGQLPNIERFELPVEHYDRILAYFHEPAVRTRPNVNLPELGAITIVDSNAQVIRIPFFWTMSKGPLEYSMKGVRCYNLASKHSIDEGLTLDLHIRTAYQELTGHIVTMPISEKAER